MSVQQANSSVELQFKVSQINVTGFDAIPHDVDVIIAVSSGLLVPEAQSVQELVLNGSQTIAVCTDGQLLLPHMLVAYRGVASTERGSKVHI